eukprot:gb/GEZN01011790.1/.p1 GENE.gb/GEZN01011790.1/~~gb/GEZN01011790.1/.p1  ORF type:complete len:312 (-),score=30.87 gb/GEZN01011790.1/:111-1046(-)
MVFLVMWLGALRLWQNFRSAADTAPTTIFRWRQWEPISPHQPDQEGISWKEKKWIEEETALVKQIYADDSLKPRTLSSFQGYGWYSRVVKNELKLLSAGTKLLWLGSGPFPWTCMMFSSFGINVTGVDISPQAIEHANYAVRKLNLGPNPRDRLRFMLGDALNVTADLLRGYDVIELACGVGFSVQMKRDALLSVAQAMQPDQVLLVRFYPGSKNVINAEAILAKERHLFPLILCGRFKVTSTMYILKAVRRKIEPSKFLIENDGPGIHSCFEHGCHLEGDFNKSERNIVFQSDYVINHSVPPLCAACRFT